MRRSAGVAYCIIEASYSAVQSRARVAGLEVGRAIARGDLQSGAAHWRKMGTIAKGKKLPCLVRRRNDEADIPSSKAGQRE